MNRRIVLLNLALIAVAGWLFWVLRARWIEMHAHEHTVLASSPQPRRGPGFPQIPPFKPMAATDYNDVAQKDVFSKDRNPNVVVDPPPAPKPPPPPPPMPALPAYYGIMNFGDPVVLLRLPKESQKNYHAGDDVGPFKLVSFSQEKIVFDWDGKIVERKPEDLVDKEVVQEVAAAAQRPAQAAPAMAAAASSVKSVGGDNEASKTPPQVGKDNGAGNYQCVPGDKSPPGTIVDNKFKKVVTQTMFGETCMWQLVNP